MFATCGLSGTRQGSVICFFLFMDEKTKTQRKGGTLEVDLTACAWRTEPALFSP